MLEKLLQKVLFGCYTALVMPEMLFKAVRENRALHQSPEFLALWVPFPGAVCHSAMVSQVWFAKLPWNTPAEKAFSLPHKEDGPWRAGQLEREAVSHGRRDAGSGKEAPQLPLKRFLVNANNISGAKCNEGKCSDLVAQLAWMEIE